MLYELNQFRARRFKLSLDYNKFISENSEGCFAYMEFILNYYWHHNEKYNETTDEIITGIKTIKSKVLADKELVDILEFYMNKCLSPEQIIDVFQNNKLTVFEKVRKYNCFNNEVIINYISAILTMKQFGYKLKEESIELFFDYILSASLEGIENEFDEDSVFTFIFNAVSDTKTNEEYFEEIV